MTKDGKHFARIIETKMGYVIQQGEVASGPGGVEEDVDSSDSEPSEDDVAGASAIVPVPEASPAKGKAKKPPKKAAAAPEAAPGLPAKRQRRATSRD